MFRTQVGSLCNRLKVSGSTLTIFTVVLIVCCVMYLAKTTLNDPCKYVDALYCPHREADFAIFWQKFAMS